MYSLERAIAAIKGEKIDTVPIDLHNFEMCAYASGIPYDKFFKNGELMAEWQINLWKRFGHDVILHENGTAATAGALGCKVEYRTKGSPVALEGVIENITDVNKLKHINVTDDPIIKELLKATRILMKEIGEKVLIFGRADQGPVDLSAQVLGIENFVMELATGEHNKEINLLLEYCTDAVIQYAKAQLKQGCIVTSIGEPIAGPDVISPQMYRTYAFPYEKMVADEIHAAGGLLALHICGNATVIIPDMIKTGADILEIDQKTDLRKASADAKGKACILGVVSPELLRDGTPEEVERATEEVLEIMSDNSRFILGPGCALAGDTPYENIDALVKTGRRLGKKK